MSGVGACLRPADGHATPVEARRPLVRVSWHEREQRIQYNPQGKHPYRPVPPEAIMSKFFRNTSRQFRCPDPASMHYPTNV